MTKTIRITSDGTSAGTRIMTHEGKPIVGVTSIKIDEIKPDGLVRATLEFDLVELDIQANIENVSK